MPDTLERLFEDTVQDLFDAENQFFKAMPKLSEAASCADLKKAIVEHTAQSERHVQRLTDVATVLRITPTGKVCSAAQELIEEAEAQLEEVAHGPVRDAAIIICSQKNEDYEICNYGTLIEWAAELGLTDIIPMLKETLAEEKAANDRLTEIALKASVKQVAAGGAK